MKRFILKLFLFAALILTLQFFMPLPKDLQVKIQEIESVFQWAPDVIYFGDSTLIWTAPSESVKLTMPVLLKTLLPDAVIIHNGSLSYQMDVYRNNLRFFIRKGCYPRCAVFPINLRSFSLEWERQPLWQFEDEATLLNSMLYGWVQFYKPLTVFKLNRLRLSRYDYLHTKVYTGDQEAGLVRDFDNPDYAEFSDENMRRKLAFRYMYPLAEDHRFIRSMRDIVRMSKAAGIEPVFYITPIDYQTAVRYLGPGFNAQVAKNVAIIQRVLSAEGVQALDLSRSLGSKDFSWPEDVDPPAVYPNEHLRLRGRVFVAENLYQAMRLKKLP